MQLKKRLYSFPIVYCVAVGVSVCCFVVYVLLFCLDISIEIRERQAFPVA